ncbi:unnamed protein product, partial [Schistocephalus solidus]|uniref:Metalloprotease n=1 Tax=Schistocephalus solidus TaxID=70667 RepID=A0A183TTD2_SCHSO
ISGAHGCKFYGHRSLRAGPGDCYADFCIKTSQPQPHTLFGDSGDPLPDEGETDEGLFGENSADLAGKDFAVGDDVITAAKPRWRRRRPVCFPKPRRPRVRPL